MNITALKPGKPLTVTITGAAGQIAYSLVPLLATGHVFGHSQRINLNLLDIPKAINALNGVVMELEDLGSPLVDKIVATDDPSVAFQDADVAILVGAFPRQKGMTRRDLLSKNVPIFQSQAKIISKVASPHIFILVVGNPANSNAMILSRSAPSIPIRNITALSRLDHNRAVSLIARRCNVPISLVSDVAIWGNHSATQYPDFTRALVDGKPVLPVLGGYQTLADDEIPAIQKRGSSIIEARGASSAMSAAVAITDHLRSWLCGDTSITSMIVPSDGSYDVKQGIWFSFPVRCLGHGSYEIVPGLQVDEFSQRYIDASRDELFNEKEEALKFEQ